MDIWASTAARRQGLTLYVTLALGITWLLWIPTLIIASREGKGDVCLASLEHALQVELAGVTGSVLAQVVVCLAVDCQAAPDQGHLPAGRLLVPRAALEP